LKRDGRDQSADEAADCRAECSQPAASPDGLWYRPSSDRQWSRCASAH